MRHMALVCLCFLTAASQTPRQEQFSTISGTHAQRRYRRTGRQGVATPDAHGFPSATLRLDGKLRRDIRRCRGIRNPEHRVHGKYRLRASRNGFVVVEYGARPSRQSGTVFDLTSPQQFKDVGLRLVPQCVITGRILDADGEPLAGAKVQLLRFRYRNGKKVLSTTNSAFTNDLGEYRWSGLTPGKYNIYAENFGEAPPSFVAAESYVPAYYPGVTDPAGAVALEVTAGTQMRAGDTVLPRARTATLKGRVAVNLSDAGGVPSVRLFAGDWT